jgi:EmrB/QacA subfamily drug resistance transporter
MNRPPSIQVEEGAAPDQPSGPAGRLQGSLGALLLICAGQFMLILDATIVNVALPSIEHGLATTQANLQWVATGYALTFGGFLLLGGRAADLFGRRRMFMVGLLVFSAASLACGLAGSLPVIVGARLAQGIGAAMVSPAALSLLTTTFHEGAARNRALGVWGTVAAGGGATGVLAGGILTQTVGWRWIFLVNVPIALAVVALTPIVLSESHNRSGRRPDLPGALTATTGLLLLVFGLTQVERHSLSDPRAWVMLAAALLLFGSFVVIELHVRDPLVPFRIFRLPTVLGADVGIFMIGSVVAAMNFFCTLYLQQVLHLSPVQTGLAWLPIPFFVAASAQLASHTIGRLGARMLLGTGLLLMAGGMLLLSRVAVGGSYFSDVLPGLILLAIGIGVGLTTATVAATSGVDDGEQGLASGLLISSQQVGFAAGLAVLATVAASATRASTGQPALALVAGFRLAFLVALGFALAGAIAAVSLVRRADCDAELRRRRVQLPLHRHPTPPVSGLASACWPAVTALHEGNG